ncbi:immune-associated nucleotide-binding protein 9-like [Pistacia vera]|uniref:immune-associated nucleotide-binding protein 9-like n=1 Tax=Pistacia vera TaxID=55513 RepID=UPI00126379D0|nr:immune-associated nucleotide-binding protein 9-like [Pistacia vera]
MQFTLNMLGEMSLFDIQKGAMKLHDQQMEVDSLKGYSEGEISALKEQFERSYEDQLKRDTKMVELKLTETTNKLEQQLATEQGARLKAKEKAQAAQMKSNIRYAKLA